MKAWIRVLLLAMSCSVGALAQQAPGWAVRPEVVVIGSPDDPRQGLVREAVEFWNARLHELGSGFRLGAVRAAAVPLPEEALVAMSRRAMAGPMAGNQAPPELRELPGDIAVVLAQEAIVSFAGPFSEEGRRIVGIRSLAHAPMNLPNVARNVIAHELGHAIGLLHSGDATNLMCGRPAACRVEGFQGPEGLYFPLSDADREALLRLYPPQWTPRSR